MTTEHNTFQFKQRLFGYESVAQLVYPLLGWGPDEERKPCIIAIDGDLNAGKTSLANWLAWQFGATVLHLDLYEHSGSYRFEEISSIIEKRTSLKRLVIVEGVYTFRLLKSINLLPDFKVWMELSIKCNDAAAATIDKYLADNEGLRDDAFVMQGYEGR